MRYKYINIYLLIRYKYISAHKIYIYFVRERRGWLGLMSIALELR